ncbi:universal stress protein [Methanosarcina sp. KYL-1]|uniref:universal stress protein n=1 Tax=Methanosarcina sp. KYL-1 TaxID=2602068 RepID=UPI002100FFA0|nr:universal stress protein [Methanosarcina sp. KYL-1]MCQ1534763.1 universal stress protein [Methanosarcina sp. KYL-1]
MKSDYYKKILIATDGSENARQAIRAGMEIARLSQAKVYALYVMDTTVHSLVRGDDRWKKTMDEQFKTQGLEATVAVEEAAKEAGIEVEFVTFEGRPAEKILSFAEEQDMDMIVVGSLGKTDIERFLLGSVSEKVVRNTKVPVLVVPGKSS